MLPSPVILHKEIQGAGALPVDDETPGAEALPAGGAMTGVGDTASVIPACGSIKLVHHTDGGVHILAAFGFLQRQSVGSHAAFRFRRLPTARERDRGRARGRVRGSSD